VSDDGEELRRFFAPVMTGHDRVDQSMASHPVPIKFSTKAGDVSNSDRICLSIQFVDDMD
jgi:hypothetical protein